MLLLFIPVSNLFRTEVMRADGLRAKQLRDIMDARNTEIYNIAVQMSLDPRVKEFLYTKAPLNHIGNYYINDVSQVIKSYGTGNSFISFIAIYFKHGSMVVTSEGKYDANYFFENVLKYDGIKSDELKDLMSQTYYKTTMPLYKISSVASINGEYITYVQSIPIGERNSAANIIILIEKKNIILNTGQLNLQNKEQIMIINDEGEIIFTNGQHYVLKEDDINKILMYNKNYFISNTGNDNSRNSTDLENSMEVSTEEGNNAIVSYARSDVNDWTYIIISDIQNILTKVNKIRNLTIIIILFTFAVVIFLSLIMGDLSYSPWNKLTKYISTLGNSSINTSPYTNEYQYALGTIENLVMEKERLKHDVEKNNSYLINQMLLNICTGKNSTTELSKVALVLTYKSNMVIVADFDDNENLRSKIIAVLVRWSKLYLKNCKLFSFMDDKKRICIVINSDPVYKNITLDKINYYKNSFSKHFNITLYAGVGNFYESIDKLNTSYSEAKKSLEYCYIKGNDAAVFFPDINKHIFTFLNLPVHSGNPLLNSVKIGDYNTCLKLLKEYKV